MDKFISRPGTPFDGPLDTLLADISIRIQRSQTDYSKAVDRYEAVSGWIDRKDSPLEDRVIVFYPQGSMAIGAVIASRATAFEQVAFAEAESEPVPTPQPIFRKSKAVIVLQLLKRWRNLCYQNRAGRRPPSILLSRLIADAANHTDRLSEELLHQARHLQSVFQTADREGRLVHIANPVCDDDILTDRWPESPQSQRQFLRYIERLVHQLERLDGDCDLQEMRTILADLFGEVPATSAVTAFGDRMGQAIQAGQSQHRPGVGGLVIPAIGLGAPAVTAEPVRTTPAHTFYGEERTKQPC